MELPEKIDGLLFYDTEKQEQFRIHDEKYDRIRAVVIHPTKLIVRYFKAVEFAVDFQKGVYKLVPEEPRIVDVRVLNDRDKADYFRRLDIINALKKELGGDLLEYKKRSKTALINSVFESFGVQRSAFRKWLLRYIQSGQKEYSLLNHFKAVNGKQPCVSRNVTQKLGKKSLVVKGKVLEAYDYMVFDEVLKMYKREKGKLSFRECWLDIRQQFYNVLTITGQGSARNLIPVNQYPTECQARYYADQRLTPEEKHRVKHTAKEEQNEFRLLNSDTVFGTNGPMGICQGDAWDAGIILVDDRNPNITIGKPTVYAIIDCYSKAIIAFYVTYNRDSFVGLSSLMLSLLDDKSSLRQGRENPDAVWFPGAYLPNSFRVDRGSDFASGPFDSICNRLNINRELVPGAMGSYKGDIERLWGRIDTLLTAHVTKHGKINHKHGEKPYTDAILTIHEYTKIVQEAVIGLNSEPVLGYPVDDDMIAKHVDLTPKSLWEYGVNKYFEPRTILDRDQYIFDMMLEDEAKVSRSGVTFNGLFYDNPDDKKLQRLRMKTQDKGVPIVIRYDPRSVNCIWYHWEDEPGIRKLSLMTESKSGMASYAGMTFQQYGAYLKEKKLMIAEGVIKKDEIRSAVYLAEKAAVKEIDKAKKDLPKRTNKKPSKAALANAKEEERQRTAIENYIEPEEKTEKPAEEPAKKKWVPVDYETALADFDD